VTEQCQRFVWNFKGANDKGANDKGANDKVNFTLYYETLCPDCRQFIKTQVSRAFQSIADIMNISFVPYGNAREIYRPETKLYQFYCQHGSDECYGNLIHVNIFVLFLVSIEKCFANLL
jgi:interferon gamma-inducible protein 30